MLTSTTKKSVSKFFKSLLISTLAVTTLMTAVPAQANASVVKHSWSDTVYQKDGSGKYKSLSFAKWNSIGRPQAQTVKIVPGTYIYKWASNAEVGAITPDGKYQWLTYGQWQSMGFPAPDNRSNEGYYKYPWSNTIFRLDDMRAGRGYAVSYDAWKKDNFPTPATVNRLPGDSFYTYHGTDGIWRQGANGNKTISFHEWQLSGSPAPVTRGYANYQQQAEGFLSSVGCSGIAVKVQNNLPGDTTGVYRAVAVPWDDYIIIKPNLNSKDYKSAIAHECGHIKQWRAYGSSGPGWTQMMHDMNRIYGGSGYDGLEQNADCITHHMGFVTNSYTSNCSGERGRVAGLINQERRP